MRSPLISLDLADVVKREVVDLFRFCHCHVYGE